MLADDKDAELKEDIARVYHQHKGRYGYRRVTAAICNTGRKVDDKKIQRLMVQLNLRSLVRPKKYKSYKGEVGQAAPNELQRDFRADRAREKLTTDVTEFTVGGRKLYLSPVMDLFNGEIIAYEVNKRPVFELVGAMLNKALLCVKENERPILHSDQGWQYRMSMYREVLAQRGVIQSMSRKGNCLDNAAMESFFAILKTEFFHLNKFDSVEQLTEGLHEYIDYYNNDRIKMKLGGMSPVQYRTHAELRH